MAVPTAFAQQVENIVAWVVATTASLWIRLPIPVRPTGVGAIVVRDYSMVVLIVYAQQAGPILLVVVETIA